ncbi:MAG: type II toxin-antitoxin system HicA family toxin [Candidatus Omnitrophica bacterium]|nr:type II toxin-antitoxin system HicA family toxin [Candidatus Omnitrophota bacterium]
MSKLPVVSGQKVIKALQTLGYTIRSQEGSHVHLRHPGRPPLTIPNHKEIARGTLRAIIRQANLSVEEFIRLLS